jgi:hypothetical protein
MAAPAPQPPLFGKGGKRADAAKMLRDTRDVVTLVPAGAEDYQTSLRDPAAIIERARSAYPNPHPAHRLSLSS